MYRDKGPPLSQHGPEDEEGAGICRPWSLSVLSGLWNSPRPQGRGGMAEGPAMSLVFTRVVCVRVCVCVKSLSRAPRNVLYCMPALCQQRHLKKKKITHIYLSP